MPTTKKINYRKLLSVRSFELFRLRRCSPGSNSLKCTFDFLISAALLIGFGWLIVMLIIAIRITSSGRAIFAQERVGLEGKDVHLLQASDNVLQHAVSPNAPDRSVRHHVSRQVASPTKAR